MFASHSHVVYEIACERRLLPPEQIEQLFDEHRTTGRPFADLLMEIGGWEKSRLLAELAAALGLEHVDEPPTEVPAGLSGILPGDLARRCGVVPYRQHPHRLDVLCVDPFNAQVGRDLAFALGQEVGLVVADPEAVDTLIKAHYGEEDADLARLVAELPGQDAVGRADPTGEELENLAGQTPIIRFVNRVLAQAIRDRASDIHFEPFEFECKIRFRVDGTLREIATPPRHLALAIASRLKVIADLDIAERRVPQDGRIKLTLGGRPVDLRVSTLPTQFGESVVLRVLDPDAVSLDLQNLGMTADVLAGVQDAVHRPNGVFVVTGPTGSGKTTTLYCCLRILNSLETKILSAEDPVEYEIEGVMQSPMNPSIGLTFATALRSFLRQDPDIIMVGEIRDLETAQIAIQASLTGHLVLTTLHTNDAPGAVTRLIDMGVAPFLIASTLEAVLAQRLVRRICQHCRHLDDSPPELIARLGLAPSVFADRTCFRGRGCVQCNETGYRGRLGLFEFLRFSESLRELVVQRAPAHVLRDHALAHGMQALRESGLQSVFAGTTTIEEVLRCT